MSSWPRVEPHYFDHTCRSAVCIKIRHLPLNTDEEDALFDIISNETLGAFLWQDLCGIIDEMSAEHGIKMYTGGRSSGWLYAEDTVYDGDFAHEVLQATALRMLEETKEHIARYYDPQQFGWCTVVGKGMDVYFWNGKASLVVDGKTLAGYSYSNMPATDTQENRIIRTLLVKALRSAIDLTTQEE